MPLVEAKCTNCGAALQVDNTKDAAICPYCQTPFIVEKAINNYHVTNNITAGNVNIISGVEDFEIRAGTLVKYNGSDIDVVIPENVVAIGLKAFIDCAGLRSVVIPEGVIEIGTRSFENCTHLKEVTIPASVSIIEHGAFGHCKELTSISIPYGVKSIGNHAFYGCTGLTSITIPDSVTSIGEAVFSHCTGLTSITLPGSITEISNQMFNNCSGLTNVTIPDGVTNIGSLAFINCTGLTSVTFPASLKHISNGAFNGCKQLKSVTFSESVSVVDGFTFPPITKVTRTKEKKGGCYVATAIYGSYDCPQVWTLRRFRDQRLALTWYGRLFIALYYAVSPTVVKWFGQTAWFNRFWRGRLDRMVRRLQKNGYEATPYSD